jgi:hypothetical protein
MVFGDAIGSYSINTHITSCNKNFKVVDFSDAQLTQQKRIIFNYADLFSIVELTCFSSDFDCCCDCAGVDCL